MWSTGMLYMIWHIVPIHPHSQTCLYANNILAILLLWYRYYIYYMYIIWLYTYRYIDIYTQHAIIEFMGSKCLAIQRSSLSTVQKHHIQAFLKQQEGAIFWCRDLLWVLVCWIQSQPLAREAVGKLFGQNVPFAWKLLIWPWYVSNFLKFQNPTQASRCTSNTCSTKFSDVQGQGHTQ